MHWGQTMQWILIMLQQIFNTVRLLFPSSGEVFCVYKIIIISFFLRFFHSQCSHPGQQPLSSYTRHGIWCLISHSTSHLFIRICCNQSWNVISFETEHVNFKTGLNVETKSSFCSFCQPIGELPGFLLVDVSWCKGAQLCKIKALCKPLVRGRMRGNEGS